MTTADDGTFEWHLSTSTRPHLLPLGASEADALTAVAADGSGAYEQVTLARGDELILDPVTLP